MLALPKSPNSVIDEMFRFKQRKPAGSLPRSSRWFPSRNRSYSSDGSKSTFTMSSSGGRSSYKSVRSDANFRSTKSLSMSLRDFRNRRRSRATKTTVRQTKGLELWDVCEAGQDLDYLLHTIQLYPGLIHLEQRGRTPLFLACKNGHATMAARLLEAGALADDRIYEATQDSKCRALLEEYRVVDRALSFSNSSHKKSEGEDESYETPQMQNLSTGRNSSILPKTATIQEEQEETEDFFATNGDFSACSPFGNTVMQEKDPEEETEQEMQFWMSRMMKHQTSHELTATTETVTSISPEIPEPPTVERQKSILSIAPSECSDPPADNEFDTNLNGDEAHCNCSFVECPGARSDSPVQDVKAFQDDNAFESSNPIVSTEDQSRGKDEVASSDSAKETLVEMEVSKIPESLPVSSSQPRRRLFLDYEDDDDSPAATPASYTSSQSYSTTSQSSTIQDDNRCFAPVRQIPKASSATISFSSSMESDDTESQQSSQIASTKTAHTTRQPPLVEDEDAVEQAIECTFTPLDSNQHSRSLLPSWRPLRRNRRSSEKRSDLDDYDSDESEVEVSAVSSKRPGKVEMTLDDYTETATREEATRLGLFQRMRNRSQLRRKVSKILDETENDSRDDETSSYFSRTPSAFFYEDCCNEQNHCCF